MNLNQILIRIIIIFKNNIIFKNQYKDRYESNNDCFIHVRLTDFIPHNLDVDYYLKALSKINPTNIYLATDDFNHPIIKQLKEVYPQISFVELNLIDTIKFGSTNKYIILSHGSFSAAIGYLSFFSKVYYGKIKPHHKWYGNLYIHDLVSIKHWIEID